MKYLLYVAIGIAGCVGWVITLAAAYSAGVKIAIDRALKKAGYTRASFALFNRAAKLLNRLAALTDLDGAMAGDQLSPETRQLVTDWVTDYKREISKV